MKKSNRNNRSKILVLLTLVFYISANVCAQQKTIQLTDNSDDSPISYAHFQYGSTTGITDNEGVLTINYIQGEDLYVSHVLYGKIVIKEEQIPQVDKGQFKLAKLENALHPATIIALRKNSTGQNLDVEYEDKLSHDAGSFLSQTPVVSGIRKSGSYGFDPVLRGFKYEQVNLVIDGGQSAIAACPNRMDPPASQVALNMIDNVEILKGPYSLRYGNAFGGTLNFTTQAPGYTSKFKPVGRISGSYESNGGVYRTEALAGVRTEKSNINLYTAYSEGNDYKNGEGELVLSEFNRFSYGGEFIYKPAHNHEVTVSANNNIAADVDFPSLSMDLRKDNTWLFNVKHSIKPKNGRWKRQNSMVYTTFVDHEMDNLGKKLDTRMVNAVTIANTKAYGGRTEGKISFGSAWMYLGADFKIEEADGERIREFLMGPMEGNTAKDNIWQDAIVSKTGVFAEYHFNLSQTYFIVSARMEYNQSNARNVSDNFAQQYYNVKSEVVNPGISFGLVRSFENNLGIGVWLGRVNRSGSLAERYINFLPIGLDPYEMLGNPQLKSEVNNQADVNFKWSSNKTSIELGVFYAYMENYISSTIRSDLNPAMPSSPGVRQFTNLDNAFNTGVELSWHQDLPARIHSRTMIAYVYAENLTNNAPLPEIPPLDLRWALSGSYLKQKLVPELSLRYVAQQDRVDDSFGETITPSFTTFDIKLKYSFSKYYLLAAGVQNIFNTTYYEHLSRAVKGSTGLPVYAPGRNFYLTFSVRFM